jgi:serine/threonine-protein kinase
VINPEDPLLGRILNDRYRIEARLDQGGMGTVYRGTNLSLNSPVALKVITGRLSEDEPAQERFRQEARAAAAVQHRNAVKVLDFGQSPDGLVYFVMELLEGRSLRDLINEQAPFDAARAVSLMLKIAAAVAAAHEEGMIHRDLKPANVFIAQQPYAPATVKVIDFGLAQMVLDAQREVSEGASLEPSMAGTPRYMSPEQCAGQQLTPASDVYSMGIVLYEMLAGATPFSGDNAREYALKHSTETPRSPTEFNNNIPAPLAEFVLRSLEKDPARRSRDAGMFGEELRDLADLLGLETAFDGAGPTLAELKKAGRQSPSGRLVVDLALLRENRALSTASSQENRVKDLAGEPPPAAPTAVAPVEPAEQNETAASDAAADLEKLRWEPVVQERKKVLREWFLQPMTLLAIFLAVFFLILIIVSFAMRPSTPKPAETNAAPQQGVAK